MTEKKARMTKSQWEGFRVVCEQHMRGHREIGRAYSARVSNVTDIVQGYIYWQAANGLDDHGLTSRSHHDNADQLYLSAAGIARAQQEGLL